MPAKNPIPLSLDLIAQLHPTLNEGLDTSKLFVGSSLKVWWKCQNHNHAYLAAVRHKVDGQGCAVCLGRQIVPGFNDFATLRPDIVHQFHPEKNCDLTPQNIGKNYKERVWWKCDLGHEFESRPVNRKDAASCPVCSGRTLLKGFNDVESQYPHLVEAFITERNPGVKLDEIGKSYRQKLWWKAPCGHETHALISNCIPKIPCEYCIGRKVIPGFNDIATTHPEIISHWHPTKNLPLTPQSITKASKTKIWWICEKGHEDLILPSNKISIGNRCSFCDGTKLMTGLNDLATVYPHLVVEWHPTENGEVLPEEISANTMKKYWWKCKKCSQSWDAPPSNRGGRGTGCPYCSGKNLKAGVNDLLTVNPQVGSEWHPTKNGSITAQDVTAGSPQAFWWQCIAGHEWFARVNDRVGKKSGCIECYRAGLATGTVSFVETYPHLLEEWDYVKNSRQPETMSEFANRKAWWICKVNPSHSWETTVANRTSKKSGCPVCWQAGLSSNAEVEVGDFLENLGLKVKRNIKTLLDGRTEIDVYLPEFNTGIEYNGLYWHSEAGGKDRKYHVNKYRMCQQKGISLIQIWEDSWLDKKELMMRQLAYRFKKMDALQMLYPSMDKAWFEKHHARKLSSAIISGKEAIEFLNAVHIQGGVKGSSYYGLRTSHGELVAVIVMARTGKEGEFLLSRYATKGTVAGGFTKLLKYAIEECKPQRVVTFSDHSTFEGKLYALSGFVNDGAIPEDYMYVKSKKRYHKFGFRLSKFKNDPNLTYVENTTERELAILNGYTRIWDSGKTRWVMDL